MTLPPPPRDIGLLPVLAIFVLNWLPILAFSFVKKKPEDDASERKARRLGPPLSRALDPELELVAGLLLLGLAGHFLRLVITPGFDSSAAGSFLGTSGVLGIWSTISGLRRVLDARPASHRQRPQVQSRGDVI